MQINQEQVQKIRTICPSYDSFYELAQTITDLNNKLGATYLSDEQFLQYLISQSNSGCLYGIISVAVFIIVNIVGPFLFWFIMSFILLIFGNHQQSTSETSDNLTIIIYVIGRMVSFALSIFLAIIIPKKIRKASFANEISEYRAMREDVSANRDEYTQKLCDYQRQYQQLYNEILNSPNNIIPQEYWNRAYDILKILEQGRAFDVGSAINLMLTNDQLQAMQQEIINQGKQTRNQIHQAVNSIKIVEEKVSYWP